MTSFRFHRSNKPDSCFRWHTKLHLNHWVWRLAVVNRHRNLRACDQDIQTGFFLVLGLQVLIGDNDLPATRHQM